VIVARRVDELPARRRTVAIGSFDGVHRGHRLVLETARAAGQEATVVTFWPHPRLVLGNRVELLSTLQRRLELLDEAGAQEVLIVDFTAEVAALPAEEFAEAVLRRIGTTTVVVGENFRFGRGAAGDVGVLEQLGFEVRLVPLLDGVSSTRIRTGRATPGPPGRARRHGRPRRPAGRDARLPDGESRAAA
jgi:riboflavin kinase/FMN adenylyltransferase